MAMTLAIATSAAVAVRGRTSAGAAVRVSVVCIALLFESRYGGGGEQVPTIPLESSCDFRGGRSGSDGRGREVRPGADLAFLAVEHVANGPAACLVGFSVVGKLCGRGGCRLVRVRLAACRTAIGKARLVRFQLKLLSANDTSFDRKRHFLVRRTRVAFGFGASRRKMILPYFCWWSLQAAINLASMALDRRDFLTVTGRFGLASTLFPGALYTLAAQAQSDEQKPSAPELPKITPEMIDQAAALAGITIAPEYRQAMLGALNQQRGGYEAIRKLHLPNSVAPAY